MASVWQRWSMLYKHLPEIINRKILNKRGMHLQYASPIALSRGGLLTSYYQIILDYEVRLKKHDFFYLQVGANDGVSRSDDLINYVRGYGIRGVMVEPQQDVFRKLQANYSPFPQITLVNKALHETDKEVVLYSLDVEKLRTTGISLPTWARTNGIASFSREHLAKHVKELGLNDAAMIAEAVVPCTTLDELIAEHGITTIDLLKVDTEGYDYHILRMLDLSRVRPRIIRLEHKHMGRSEYDEVVDNLLTHGYKIICERSNTSAVVVDR